MSHFVAAGLTAVVLAYALVRRLARPSLSKIRGPKSSSFVLGRSVLFVCPLHCVEVLQETCWNYFNIRPVKQTLNGKGFMETSFASRLSLEQVQSVTSITLKSNFMS